MRPRIPVWLGLLVVLAGLAFLIERLIVTDEEAVEALIEDAARAVREGDFEALTALLAPDFEAEGREREAAVAWISTLKRRWRPLGLEVEVREVVVEGDTAKAPVLVSMTVMARPVRFLVEVDSRQTDRGWRMSGARLASYLP